MDEQKGEASMARTVYKIPKTTTQPTNSKVEKKVKKVAAYARVSTDSDEQATSYQSQINYYSEYIKAHEDWALVKVYTDEGISGTSIKHREGFQEMIADALVGKIELIITKSISRFARNTVDTLKAIRQLKDKGVEVYFEKENIWSLDGKGEVLLTIMSSLAQEESRSISENVTWGIRKRFAEGKACASTLYGYNHGFQINETQAAVVKRIFSMTLQGYPLGTIANTLTEEGIPTPQGKSKWSITTVKRILNNEKYRGDALLQKTYTADFLTKKMVKNDGEVQQYYVKEHHEPLIDPEVFDQAQTELANRTARRSGYAFSGKLICGECGALCSPKTWHSNDKYKKVVWQCRDKFQKPHETSFLNTEEIEQAFVKAINELIQQKAELVPILETLVASGMGIPDLQKKLDGIIEEMDKAECSLEKVLESGTLKAADADNYNKLSEEYGSLELLKQKTMGELNEKQDRFRKIKDLLKHLQNENFMESYQEEKFRIMIESATVLKDKKIRFRFWNGTEITVSA